MKYTFGRSLSRADAILAVIVSAMYASGSWTGMQAFTVAIVGVILTAHLVNILRTSVDL